MGDKIKEIYEGLHSKLSKKELAICESDQEFFFLVGQLSHYLLAQSAAHMKSHGLTEPIVKAKKSARFTKEN